MVAESNEALRAEADGLLAGGLAGVLARYGEVHVVGSYALDLMTWRDLDIHLVPPALDLRTFFQLGAELAALLRPHRLHFRDETRAATPGLPRGLYWGAYLGDERDGAWKIDLWATDRGELDRVLRFGRAIAAQVGPRERQAILAIKAACWRHPEYRRSFTSADVYAAVLEGGVHDVDAFWTYLERPDRHLPPPCDTN